MLLDQSTVLLTVINKKKSSSWSLGLEMFPASYVFPQIETMVPFLLQPKAAQSLVSGSQRRAIVAGSTESLANSERRPGESFHPLHAEEPSPRTRLEVEVGQQGRQPAPFTLAFLLSQPARCRWRRHVLPLGPQTPSLLWVLLYFFMYLVFQPKETTSCFLIIPVLPQSRPCPCLFFCFLKS